jgi:hypothetical protein
MKKLNFLLALLCVCGVAIATTPDQKVEVPDVSFETVNSDFFAPNRYGHIRAEHEFSINVGFVSYKVRWVSCDKTPNVICVYRQGLATSTELRRGDHSLIYSGSFSHEEVEETTDGNNYSFYFYE